ncbi:hypothetical protein TNCV_3288531 [Trichonephila clavipes]|nr:hypothetical protein TNCV_3288531 [Trichonephila clavipes]
MITGDGKWISYENIIRKRTYCVLGKPVRSTSKPNLSLKLRGEFVQSDAKFKGWQKVRLQDFGVMGVKNKRERTRISSRGSRPKFQHSDEIRGNTGTALGPTDSSPQS